METILLIAGITTLWIVIGQYGYIWTIETRRSQLGKKRWRSKFVNLIPLIGLLGPFTLLAGLVIMSDKYHKRYEQ